MREWQVGDPIGDGNDIGVPDIPYMDYLKDKEETSDDNTINDIERYIRNARQQYDMKNYDDAFDYLNLAFKIYKKRNGSNVMDNPFSQYWITDLCCKIINYHIKDKNESADIIINSNLPVKTCDKCYCVYPIDYKFCTNCGNPLTHPAYRKTPEELAEELSDILSNKLRDDFEIAKLVGRSLVLMKSNDSRLVEIADSNYGINFIFEKEHKYFKTRYVCEYVPGSVRIFEDYGTTHNHEKLLTNESFKRLIKDTENKTGFTFIRCDGGYGSQLDEDFFNFIFNDKINVIARFDMGDGRTAVYDIDLDNMKLSEDYRDY